MGAGARTPAFLSRTLRLAAAALVAACWLAAPAGAADPLDGNQAPADAAAAVDRVTAPATSAGATAAGVAKAAARPVRTAVKTAATAGPVRSAVKTVAAARSISIVVETAATVRPVRGVAETAVAVGSGAPPSVGEAARRATELAAGAIDRAPARGAPGPPANGGGSQPGLAIRDSHGKGGAVTAQAARLQTFGTSAPPRSDLAPLEALLAGIPAQPAAPTDLTGARLGAAPTAAQAGLDHRSSPDPGATAGGGPAVSTGAASFLMGGLAVLLATLSLVGPALRRRLRSRSVTAWPSAFVPLLERPG
jgi:hypothetical protein